MGASKSKSAVDVINKSIKKVINKHIQTCIMNVNQSQLMDISGAGNTVINNRQKMTLVLDINCVSKLVNNTTLKDDLVNNITNDLKESFSSIFGAPNKVSELQTTFYNIIDQTVTNDTIQACSSNIQNTQVFKVSGMNNVVAFNSQESVINHISKCISDKIFDNDLTSKTINDIETSTVTEDKSGQMFVILMSVMGVVSAIILVGITYILYKTAINKQFGDNLQTGVQLYSAAQGMPMPIPSKS